MRFPRSIADTQSAAAFTEAHNVVASSSRTEIGIEGRDQGDPGRSLRSVTPRMGSVGISSVLGAAGALSRRAMAWACLL